MKVFLSARYSRKDELRKYRTILQEAGYTVNSRWLDEETKEEEGTNALTATPPEHRQAIALADIQDVRECDVLIAFTEQPCNPQATWSHARGGRHVEYGAAIALGKPVIVVGYRENIFHFLPEVYFVELGEVATTYKGSYKDMFLIHLHMVSNRIILKQKGYK